MCVQKLAERSEKNLIEFGVMRKLLTLAVLLGGLALGDTDPGLKLAAAISRGDAQAVAQLLSGNSQLANQPYKGVPPLLAAISGGAPQPVIDALLQAGANANLGSAKGMTPLANAVSVNRGEVVSSLLRAGADVSRPAVRLMTPLHYAVNLSDPTAAAAMIALLGGAKPKVDAQDDGGQSPLQRAVGRAASQGDEKFAPVVEALLKLGANPNLTYSFGESATRVTPLALAQQLRLQRTADALSRYGGQLTAPGK